MCPRLYQLQRMTGNHAITAPAMPKHNPRYLKLSDDKATYLSLYKTVMRFRSKKTPAETLKPYAPGHIIERPDSVRAGVVFASPHSGAVYPDDLLARANLSAHQLRRNEDIFIDHLFQGAVAAGAPLLKALFPRVVVDVNRAEDELPSHWVDILPNPEFSQPTARAAAGLGVVPTYLNETLPIYARLPSEADVLARIQQLYRPYHAALNQLIDEGLSRFGQVLLVDCHSMPGFAPTGARRPDVILGDRFGISCHRDTLAHIRELFQQAGYSVGINYPYAGGYVTTHYGKPHDGVEAVQIELNRDLYVNPVTLAPKSGYAKLAEDLKDITAKIVDSHIPQSLAAQ